MNTAATDRPDGKPPLIRPLVRRLAGVFGRLYPPARRIRRHGLTSFVFHDVGDTPAGFAREHHLCAPSQVFRRQAAWIARHFNIVHPDALLDGTALPGNAALITFDDGWDGTFRRGLPILAEIGLPSIVFLNVEPMLGAPFVAAVGSYLRHDPVFATFAAARGMAPPYHLSLTPSALEDYEAAHGTGWRDGFAEYQGRFATWETLEAWDGKADVRFGNHLFNHWNAAALAPAELLEQYRKNGEFLGRLAAARPIFAFPNGQPGSCFSDGDATAVRAAGAALVFSATGGVSRDARAPLLDRIALTDIHDTPAAMWYAASRRSFPLAG